MSQTKTSSEHFYQLEIPAERYEAKYVIPKSMVPEIREFIRPFCDPDPYCSGDPPEYVITTLQLDTPDLALHHAKDDERYMRFKLRARTYGIAEKSPVFVEIKRKFKRVIVKSRARIPADRWCKELILDPTRKLDIDFKSEKELLTFLEFVRLVREIGARPVVIVRYTRESHVSRVDEYARVTLDRNLLYQPTESWDPRGQSGHWRSLDSSLTQNKQYPFSGIILELKTLSHVPTWMVHLSEEFDLVRTGNCKYSTAIGMESVFRGTPSAPAYATDLLLF